MFRWRRRDRTACHRGGGILVTDIDAIAVIFGSVIVGTIERVAEEGDHVSKRLTEAVRGGGAHIEDLRIRFEGSGGGGALGRKEGGDEGVGSREAALESGNGRSDWAKSIIVIFAFAFATIAAIVVANV